MARRDAEQGREYMARRHAEQGREYMAGRHAEPKHARHAERGNRTARTPCGTGESQGEDAMRNGKKRRHAEQGMWNRGCGTGDVEQGMWNRGCGTNREE